MIETTNLTRSVCLMLYKWKLAPMTEYTLPNGRRLDVAALGKNGRLLGVEVKRDTRDFVRDLKWTDAAAWCFVFYIAVPVGFNLDIIHPAIRVIVSDGQVARIVRRTGRGLAPLTATPKPSSAYAVKAPAEPALLRAAPAGDRSRARLWVPG